MGPAGMVTREQRENAYGWVTALRRVGVRVDHAVWGQLQREILPQLDDRRRESLQSYGPEIEYLARTSPDGRVRAREWKRSPMGRWYSRGPALQTITSKMRSAVVPADGFVFADFDLKQCHLVIAAALSGDAALGADLAQHDFHALVGSRLAPGEPPDVARKKGKVINLSVLNGGAAEHREEWLAPYPRLKAWLDGLAYDEVWVRDGQQPGYPYAATRRWIGDPDPIVAGIQRQRASLVLQAHESAVMAHLMRAIFCWARRTTASGNPLDWPIRAVLLMHDGGLLEVREDLVSTFGPSLQASLEDCCRHVGLPMIAMDLKFSKTWG